MEPTYYTSAQWKRVCDLSSQLLDWPARDWEVILARECGEDFELRTCVLSVCGSYPETDELFGVAVCSPLALFNSLGVHCPQLPPPCDDCGNLKAGTSTIEENPCCTT